MTVTVNSGGTTSTYALSTDVSTINTTSKVYYTQENEEGFIEIYFGDGTLGVALLDGDIITVDYIIVDDIHADGANRFTQISAINGFTDSVIEVPQKHQGVQKKNLSSQLNLKQQSSIHHKTDS